MNPLLALAAAAAAYMFLGRPMKRAASTMDPSLPPPPPPEGEGSPRPRRPGKDSVYKGGGIKGPGGTKPPGGGGGIVLEPPTGGGPEPEPEPEPEPGHHVAVPDYKKPPLPAAIEWEETIAPTDESHEVQLTEQSNMKLPNGTYYVRLSLTMTMSTSAMINHGNNTYSWDHAHVVNYGQREAVIYKITVDGDSAVLQKIRSAQKKIGTAFIMHMFGCNSAAECGWNGKYNSYFEPRLVWNLGLEARFATRAIMTDQGINRYGAKIELTFSRDPL